MADNKTQHSGEKLIADLPNLVVADDKTQQNVEKLTLDLPNSGMADEKLEVADDKTQQNVEELTLDLPDSGMADEKTQQSVEKLTADLPNLGRSMHLFSSSMRSLYCEMKVSVSVENGEEFISLRDATRNDAVAYLRGVMPLNESCLMKLQQYVSYYESLEFDDWKECLPDILMEVVAYREACQALVKVHDTFRVTLKKREDKAIELCSKFEELHVQYDEEIKELRKKAEGKQTWAASLASVPLLGSMVGALSSSGESDLADAVAKEAQLQLMSKASKSVTDDLMPALGQFINGLMMVADFFDIMHNEMRSFDETTDDKKKFHYMMLRNKSREIKAGCRSFHGVLPSVRTDFQAIPTERTDENYVDDWLKKQKKIIEENRKKRC